LSLLLSISVIAILDILLKVVGILGKNVSQSYSFKICVIYIPLICLGCLFKKYLYIDSPPIIHISSYCNKLKISSGLFSKDISGSDKVEDFDKT